MKLTCVTFVALLAASPAMAWTTSPGTGQHQGQHQTATGGAGGAGGAGGTGGSATSNSTASSTASGGNVIVNTAGGAGRHGSSGSGNGNGWNNNVPPVYAPSVEGGNSCAVGTSGGLGVAGFGIAFGATYAAQACERRAKAALLWNMGEKPAAIRLLCTDDEVGRAMGATGCNPAAAPPATPVSYPPDWCFTASAGERLQHKECRR